MRAEVSNTAFFIAVIAVLISSVTPLPAAQLETPKGRINLKESSADGTNWVCGSELAKALGGSLATEKNYGRPVLTVANHRVLLSLDTSVVSVDGTIVKMKNKPVERDGCIQLPVEFLSIVQAWYTKGLPPPAQQEKAPLRGDDNLGQVVISLAPEGGRITLEGKATVDCTVHEGEKSLEVMLRSGTFKTPVLHLPSGLVANISVEDGSRTMRCAFTAGYVSLERLKFKNPERLTFVLHGTASAEPPVSQPPTETGKVLDGPKPPEPPGPLTAPPKKTPALDVIVLDPGHGGSEAGAEGPDVLEKDLTLDISRKCAEVLGKDGIKVLLTRESDVTVPLVARTAFANKNQADIFISIHLNSSPSSKAHGTEIYYHSTEATDQWAKRLAERENSSPAPTETKEGIDLVLWDLAQESYIRQSARLAEIVQLKFNDLLSTKNRGVHQAPFRVLQGAQMPAVLVEVAFLSNQGEAKKLVDKDFQAQVAQSLAEAIGTFKLEVEEPGQAE